MKKALARFIASELLGDDSHHVGEHDDLLTSGLIDSLGVMSLIFFIEQELGLEVPPEDVTIENFLSIETIDRYLSARKP